MNQRRRAMLLLVLAVIAIASGWRVAAVERQKQQLARAYAQAQQIAQQLEAEREHLNNELVKVRQTVESQAGDIDTLQQELQEVQTRFAHTMGEIASLKKAHAELRQQNASLTAQLDEVGAEKRQLEAKLSDLQALKLAIRDVKRKMWQERFAAWRAHAESQRQTDQLELASGNRGYVLRQGVPTLSTPLRLHVHVLEPESQ